MSDGYYRTVANRTRVDTDGRSPKLRLSVVAYLLDAGVKPDEMGTDKFMEFVDQLVNWTTEELDSYLEDIVKLDTDTPETPLTEKEQATKDAYDILQQGYL